MDILDSFKALALVGFDAWEGGNFLRPLRSGGYFLRTEDTTVSVHSLKVPQSFTIIINTFVRL